MTARSFNRGHAMWYDDIGQVWRYESDDLPVKDFWRGKPCGKCDKHQTPEGHDPCLGTLPNVINACCGHGNTGDAYVIFSDGQRVAGEDAVKFFDVAKGRTQ